MQTKSRNYPIVLVLLLVQTLIIVRNTGSDFFSFLWYCDFVPGLLAVAFLSCTTQAVKGILNVGFFAQLGYTIIILYKILFQVTLFNFVFDFPFTIDYVLPALIIHITTLLALYHVYKEKPTKESLYYSLLLLISMYLIVTTVALSDGLTGSNYNFMFHLGGFNMFPHYTQAWVPLAFFLVIIPTHFFQYGMYTYTHTGSDPKPKELETYY